MELQLKVTEEVKDMPQLGIIAPAGGEVKTRSTEISDPMDPVVTIEYCKKNELCTEFMTSYWDYFYTD